MAWGEGWHNNHHAFPRVARHGHRWWELDMSYMTIQLMKRLGLAWNVVPVPATIDSSVTEHELVLDKTQNETQRISA